MSNPRYTGRRLSARLVRQAYEETGLRPHPHAVLSPRGRRADPLGAAYARRVGVAHALRLLWREHHDQCLPLMAAALHLSPEYARGFGEGYGRPVVPHSRATAAWRAGYRDGRDRRRELRDLERTDEPAARGPRTPWFNWES